MAATIKVWDVAATFDDSKTNPQWESERANIAQLLNTLTPFDWPGGDDPNPAYTLAQHVIQELGTGEITSFDPTERDEVYPPGTFPEPEVENTDA